MRKIAITGVASRFARVLLPLLEADPEIEQIVGIDLVPPVGTYNKLAFYQRDVRDPCLEELFSGCDCLVHLAFIVGRPCSMSLQEAASINLAGTWNTCHAAAQAGVRKLVVSSSVSAYGSLPDNPDPLVEESPLRGLYTTFYYSQHKHANEIWLDGFQLAFPHLLISRLRPCIVIGPNQFATANLIQSNLAHFTTKEAYQGCLQLIHEDDLASAFFACVKYDLPGAYNVVADGSDSLPNIAAAAGLEVIEVPSELIVQATTVAWEEGTSPIGPEWVEGEDSIFCSHALLCSNAKFKATGAWTPCYSTTQAFAVTVAALTSSP